jgi:hypothetical protein
MVKCAIVALALLALGATGVGAKEWAKDLDDRDEAKRARAARELLGKAVEAGLTGAEVEALAEAVDDPSREVQDFAIRALASNTKIATSQEYAPHFANRGNNFVAFLLWYSIYNTYGEFLEVAGGEGSGDLAEERAYAEREARRAFANTLDPARKDWAAPYAEKLGP